MNVQLASSSLDLSSPKMQVRPYELDVAPIELLAWKETFSRTYADWFTVFSSRFPVSYDQ
jgi:hypothetical protein